MEHGSKTYIEYGMVKRELELLAHASSTQPPPSCAVIRAGSVLPSLLSPPSPPRSALLRRRRRGGFPELSRVDGHVQLDVGQRHVFLSVKPGDLQVKRNLDAVDVAVVAVVDLCR